MRPFRRRRREEERSGSLTLDQIAQQIANAFSFNGISYPLGLQQTLVGNKQQLGRDFEALVEGAYKRNGVVFACELVRLMHFSEATFKFRRFNNGRPGNLFGSPALKPLEEPWDGGTTGDLLMMMMLHGDMGGSAYVRRQPDGRLAVLRPDWMTLVLGTNESPKELAAVAADARVLGYVYEPPGGKPLPLLPEEVAQFTPVPDPVFRFAGMSWLRPVLADIKGDKAAAALKLAFFENGATPNLKVTFNIPDEQEFKRKVDAFKAGHEGATNAYKTLFLSPGVDAEVIGADFKEMDFKQTTGVSETRIAAAAGTPPIIVGLSEGLQGSSLNAGNYNSARRRFSDGTMRPLWRNAAGSLTRIINVPTGAQLWYDDRDIAFLREDMQERSHVQQQKAEAISSLVTAGFTPESVIAAVEAEDFQLLEHSGAFSVQLHPPGSAPPADRPS